MNIEAQKASDIIEAVIAKGDIAQLTAQERARYYVKVCESLGLNPMTRPFEYIVLNGKLTLYARKDATDQLRSIHGVSVTDLTQMERNDVLTIVAKVTNKEGRSDMATGAVHIGGLKGEALANAIMKAETKAKRRATLSICGLGFLDETELPAAAPAVSPKLQARPRLADQLDALSFPTEPQPVPAEKRKRGRPKKQDDDEDLDEDRIERSQQRLARLIDDPSLGDDPDLLSTVDGDDVPDYFRGKADAELGRKACLDSRIRDDEARFADWQRGYDSVKRGNK
jgi:hypothetical protein